MAGKNIDNLKTLLKNAKSTTGTDLHVHLHEVINDILQHFPDDALDKFEEISYLVKHKNKIPRDEFL
jgi:NADH dehydrogenase FAD-containing subunit